MNIRVEGLPLDPWMSSCRQRVQTANERCESVDLEPCFFAGRERDLDEIAGTFIQTIFGDFFEFPVEHFRPRGREYSVVLRHKEMSIVAGCLEIQESLVSCRDDEGNEMTRVTLRWHPPLKSFPGAYCIPRCHHVCFHIRVLK